MLTVEQIKYLIAINRLDLFYNDYDWRKLSKEIIADNHNECMMCADNHKVSTAVLVHHVQHLKEHPELAYSRYYIDAKGRHIQLMPLCHDCHEKIHKRGIYSEIKGFVNQERWD